jgi:hypothetical protein
MTTKASQVTSPKLAKIMSSFCFFSSAVNVTFHMFAKTQTKSATFSYSNLRVATDSTENVINFPDQMKMPVNLSLQIRSSSYAVRHSCRRLAKAAKSQ